MRCYMVHRPMARLVVAAMLNIFEYEAVDNLLSNIMWHSSRLGREGNAFATDVCYLVGCTQGQYLAAESAIFQ